MEVPTYDKLAERLMKTVMDEIAIVVIDDEEKSLREVCQMIVDGDLLVKHRVVGAILEHKHEIDNKVMSRLLKDISTLNNNDGEDEE